MDPEYYKGAHVVIYAYDLTSEDSLFDLDKWLSQSKPHLDINNKIVALVGLKSDEQELVEVDEAMALNYSITI